MPASKEEAEAVGLFVEGSSRMLGRSVGERIGLELCFGRLL